MDIRRRMINPSTLSSVGGVQEPDWPVYLTYGSDNGEAGIKLYNYLISILPENMQIFLPTTEYKIGDIIINGYGTISILIVHGFNKSIIMINETLGNEYATPTLGSNGYLS